MSFNLNKCVLVVLSFCAFTVSAQIQPISSHYMFNPQVTNPAFYGSKNGINFGANYRHQWAELNGQPRTINVFSDAAITKAHGGIGFNISNDMLGAFTNTSFNIGYAFIQDINKKFKIAVGVNAGAVFSRLDGTKLITPQGSGVDLNDVALSNQLQKSIRPALTVGVSFIHKYIETGISYSNVINLKDKFQGEIRELNPEYGSVFQTYISSKVKIGSDFYVRPSMTLNTDFKELQTDFSFMAGYRDYISLGLNVRGYNKKSFESLSPVICIGPIKNISIIYNYDVSLNKLNAVNSGSHEISLNYFLPNSRLYKNPKIINNPRFL